MRVLLLDAMNKNTLSIVRHLGRRRLCEIDLVYHAPTSVALYSRYVRKRIWMPNPKTERDAFVKHLLTHLSRTHYDILMPVGFRTHGICASHRAEIQKLTSLIITTEANMEIASNKIKTYALADRLGVPYPKTVALKDPGEISKISLDFPVVIKAPLESGINIVDYASDANSLYRKYLSMCERYEFKSLLPLVQEYIVGAGYGFFAYYEEGVCKRIFMHRRIREYPVTGGASVCAESFWDEELIRLGKKMLDDLHWDGIAMVEFKKDVRDGSYKLMEINPKFWGSLDLALCSGVLFPHFLIRRAAGESLVYSDTYKQTRFQWILNGEVFHFLEKPGTLASILKDGFRSKNDLWITDPAPNVYQLVLLAFHLIRRIFKHDRH